MFYFVLHAGVVILIKSVAYGTIRRPPQNFLADHFASGATGDTKAFMAVDIEKDYKFQEIKQRLVQHFKPTQMYLFGSRATGNHLPTSDYDILLVVDKDQGSRIDNMLKASRLVDDLDVSIDVFVYPQDEFESWKNEMNSIPETAFTEGQVIPLG